MKGRGFSVAMAAVAASATAAGAAVTGVHPVGNPGDWITPNDYPNSALQASTEGVTGFRLDVDTKGDVAGCTVTHASGTASLDEAACTLLSARAHFTPAIDARGHAIASTYSSSVRWQIPDDRAAMAKTRFQTCLANDGDAIQVETPFGCAH